MTRSLRLSGPSPAAQLEIDTLRAFVAIAERGGVTAASERVGRTPAALSMQLKKLEATLGRPLFERSTKGMTPTADGERLLGYARKMLALHNDALDLFRDPALSGDVRLGLIDDFGDVRLSEVLAQFAECYPSVNVTVAMGPTGRLYKQLDDGELDFSLLTPGGATEWRSGDVLAHQEPLVWTGRAGGSAFRLDPVPIAISDVACAWRHAALAALDQAGRSYRIAYTSELYAGQKAAVRADLAVAPLPLSIVEPGFEILGNEQGLPPVGESRLALRWAQGPRAPAAQALADRLVAAFDGRTCGTLAAAC